MIVSDDLEHGGLIGAISDAIRAKTELIDLIRTFSPKISRVRDNAIADELSSLATLYWESAGMLEPLKQVADQQGEETMGALVDAQIKILREVSARLNRRAAAIRGVSEEELAARAVLTLPADTVANAQTAVTVVVCCSCCTEGKCSCADGPADACCLCQPCTEAINQGKEQTGE